MTVAGLISEASSLRAGAAGSQKKAQTLVDTLAGHRDNWAAVRGDGIRQLCPTKATAAQKASASANIAKLDTAIAQLRAKHNLGVSTATKVVGGVTVGSILLGTAHYFDKLPTSIAQYIPAMPSISMPSIPSFGVPTFVSNIGGSIANATTTLTGGVPTFVSNIGGSIANATTTLTGKVAATATAIDTIWGVSSVPAFTVTNAIIGTSLFAVALLAAYAAKNAMKQKQA